MRFALQLIFIAVLTALIYVRAPHASFLPIDDGSLTYNNPIVTEFDVAKAFSTYDPELYIPLTLLSYQVEYFFAGANPMIYHMVNVLLHMLNAMLVCVFVRYLTKNIWIAWITGLLFAVHPLHTEAVMWIAARKDLLSTAFFLGSLIAYCRYRETGARWPWYLGIVLFACALMSKVVTASLPLVLLLIDDVLPTKTKRHPHEKLPYYVLASLFLIIGILGKTLSIYNLTLFQSFLLACKSAAFYLQQLLLPNGLMMFYQQLTPITSLSAEFLLPPLLLLLLYIIALKGRHLHRFISFCILWYGITLLPSLSNFTRVSKESIFFASDRYAYIPSIGVLMLVAFGICFLWERYKIQEVKALIVTGVVSAICMLSMLTYRQSLLWLAPGPLFANVIHTQPKTHLAYTMLGIVALGDDRYREAIGYFAIGATLEPEFAENRAQLGLALIKDMQINRGIYELESVIKSHPDFVHAYAYLAYGQLLQGNTSAASDTVSQLLTLEPDNAKAFQLLGAIAEASGDRKEAHTQYERALALSPNSIRIKAALARLIGK